MIKYLFQIPFVFLCCKSLLAQKDSIRHKKLEVGFEQDSTVLFKTKIAANEEQVEPKLLIDAYLSTYYAIYTEDNTIPNFVKHATMAARNKEFGLNMAMIGLSYKSKKLRSTITLHYGDVATSTWPNTYNMIQEANAGVELANKLWLDVGIFRSHIGLESTQPRENITSSMSLANVYEPYYFSGAKLTYQLFPKLSVQLNVFNSFSSIIETNKNKLIGTSLVFSPNENITMTYNFITGDDTPDSSKFKYQRYYHNFYATYQKKKWSLGVEGNLGIQEYSKKINVNTYGTAYMNSALVVAKHQTFRKTAFYGRAEWFSDEDEILAIASNLGKYTWGATFGIEYKPMKNMAISLEGRQLNSDRSNVWYNNNMQHQRLEGIFCVDVWF